MKKLTTLLIFMVLAMAAHAQDVIIKNDKSEIKCLVTEIAETAVKYKKWENQTGPTYSIAKAEVFMIRYENGTTETFDAPAKKEESKPAPAPAPEKEAEPIKPLRFTVRAGLGFANPLLMPIYVNGETGSASTVIVQFSTLPNKEKWLTSASSIHIVSATANNYLESGVNVSFSGVGFHGKFHGHWYRSNSGSFYSGIGIGGVFGSVSVSDPTYKFSGDVTGLSYQLDLIGVQHTWKHFGLFSELGYGYEGIWKSGLYVAW